VSTASFWWVISTQESGHDQEASSWPSRYFLLACNSDCFTMMSVMDACFIANYCLYPKEILEF